MSRGPIELGSPEFRAASRALFAVGLATFAMLYCVQPLQPVFSEAFDVTAAESSLSLSLTTGSMAPMLLVSSALSDAIGRKRLILWSIFASVALTALAAASPDWTSLLWFRLLVGITLSGVQAAAMAYVGEEVAPGAVGYAMGLFVSGSSLGGLAGRLAAGLVNDASSWRLALATISLVALAAGLFVWRALPESRAFTAARPGFGTVAATFLGHMRNPALRPFYALAFLGMGGFVATYSLVGYRLLAPPFGIGQGAASLVFLFYLVGAAVSTAAGRLSDRVGPRTVLLASILLALLGIAVTLVDHLAMVIAGLGLFTAGFFGLHATASGGVGRVAGAGRAQASALYLFSFYLGSSALGSTIALLWPGGGWPAVAACVAALYLAALAVAALAVPRRA